MDCSVEGIDTLVKGNDIVLFMKGTPASPMCGFSARAVGILNHLEAKYESVDVFEYPEIRQNIKTYSNWPTLPQLFVKGELVGGVDIMMEMFEAGELQTMLKSVAAK